MNNTPEIYKDFEDLDPTPEYPDAWGDDERCAAVYGLYMTNPLYTKTC